MRAGIGRRVVWSLVIALVVVIVVAGGMEVRRLTLLNRQVRQQLEMWLSDRLASDVSIDGLEVSLVPRVTVRARGITIRIPGRADLPPFVTVDSWSGSAELSYSGVRHFDEVTLEGVRITVPPQRMADLRSSTRSPSPAGPRHPPAITIGRLFADRVAIVVMPRDAGREPHSWDVRQLRMTQFSFDDLTPFDATVDTPLPDDRATVSGTVGPWPRGEFRDLPMSGTYKLVGTLDGVNGLRGALEVEGQALGTLDRLETTGEASSPGASLEGARGTALPLKVSYHALFDATNANVRLTRVQLQAGAARLRATGDVLRVAGSRVRSVSLAVRAESPRGGTDLLRLILDPAPVRGGLGFDVAVQIAPKDAPMLSRLSLRGRFDLVAARFLETTVQQALDTLSAQALGHPSRVDPRVPTSARGEVTFSGGRLRLANATLDVPGADVDGGGSYSLTHDTVDFRGVARLEARLSQTQRGFKRWLLKPFNALFSHDGAGTRLVLSVSGAREKPEVDVDLGASLRGER